MELHTIAVNGSQLVMIPADHLKAFGEQIAEKVYQNLMAQRKETFLTTKQAAKMLNVDITTLYRWDREGYLKAARVGNKRRYRLSDIEKLLEVK